MAGVFPYRGPGNPVPGPLAPLPDYMSEEKLQEKGEGAARWRGDGPGVRGARARRQSDTPSLGCQGAEPRRLLSL